MPRRLVRYVVYLIIMASWCANASAITGNQLAEICGVTSGPSRSGEACIGYITGVVDSTMWERIMHTPLPKPDDPQFHKDLYRHIISVYCPPNGVTPEQIMAVVMKYLRDNPADWHLPLPAARYVVMALETAFPCKP